jgi:hypothetical protein
MTNLTLSINSHYIKQQWIKIKIDFSHQLIQLLNKKKVYTRNAYTIYIFIE